MSGEADIVRDGDGVESQLESDAVVFAAVVGRAGSVVHVERDGRGDAAVEDELVEIGRVSNEAFFDHHVDG